MTESSYENKIGVTGDEIATLAIQKFGEMLGKKLDDTDLAAHNRWVDGVEFLFGVCTARTEARWGEIARRLAAYAMPRFDYDDSARVLQLALEATARHIVNLIMAEDRSEFDDAVKYDWREWLLGRLRQPDPQPQLQEVDDED